MKNTKEQEGAITATGKTQILSAAAGSGKTSTLVAKIGKDQEKGVSPDQQIVITFTNAAAAEFRERIIRRGFKKPSFTGTLHAFALRHVGKRLGRPRMIGDRDLELLIKQALDESKIRAISISQGRELIAGDGKGIVGVKRSARAAIMARVKQEKVLHPDMILPQFLKQIGYLNFPTDPVIYVDEFQDTSPIDSAIYKELSTRHGATLFTVGDPRQAIFGFRGATSAEFLSMWNSAEWKGQLTANFRSSHAIVKKANIICNMMNLPEGMKVSMKPKRDFKGDEVEFTTFDSSEAEAEKIADKAESLYHAGELNNFAVITRYNASVEMITEVIRSRGIKVNSSIDKRKEAWGLQQEETVKQILQLKEIPESWEYHLIKMDAPKNVRDKLLPYLNEVDSIEELATMFGGSGMKGEEDAVTVSTVHASKGLEWDDVWIASADGQSFRPENEEDVRLAYVAVTRARNNLTISHAESRSANRRLYNLKKSPIFKQ